MNDCIELINGAINGYGNGFNANGIKFPEDYEEWEERIPENTVEIYDNIEKILLNRSEYLNILLLVSKEILKIQKSKKK